MVRSKPQFVVDDKGRKRAVLLSIKEYQEMIDHIEDLEDALELDDAVKNAEGFKKYSEIR